jgi:hypothetical protein
MNEKWRYQIRIYLDGELAEVARVDQKNDRLKRLLDVLARYHAVLKCQFDAFAEYVDEAEKSSVGRYPLYQWTKATIGDPEKRRKYMKAFSLYAGGAEVYSKEIADAIQSDLQPLVDSGLIRRMSKHDTNPVNNPQPPARPRK